MARKGWSEAEKQRIKSVLGTMPVEQAAKLLGITKVTITSACARYGWSYAFYNKPYKHMSKEQQNYIRLNAGEITTREMAQHLGIEPDKIRKWASYNKVSLRLPVNEKENAAIDHHDKELIKALFKDGMPIHEIAVKFDITKTYCRYICEGK